MDKWYARGMITRVTNTGMPDLAEHLHPRDHDRSGLSGNLTVVMRFQIAIICCPIWFQFGDGTILNQPLLEYGGHLFSERRFVVASILFAPVGLSVS